VDLVENSLIVLLFLPKKCGKLNFWFFPLKIIVDYSIMMAAKIKDFLFYDQFNIRNCPVMGQIAQKNRRAVR
jgi:hypothetical protein